MILIINDKMGRLCGDGHWRQVALFGTYKSCVKEYKSLGQARLRAKRLGGHVVSIPDGMTIEAGGVIIETVPAETPGYVNYVHHTLKEFIIPDLKDMDVLPQCSTV